MSTTRKALGGASHHLVDPHSTDLGLPEVSGRALRKSEFHLGRTFENASMTGLIQGSHSEE